MSWWGGGEISEIPGMEWRVLAITSLTLNPGSCPPSPGFAPWATLICISSAFTKYSAVTPKRPEATCLMAERRERPSSRGVKRAESSPPSPVLLRPCILFIAIAIVSCASLLIEPKLMAPVTKRFMISLTGSTSSIGMDFPVRKVRKSRRKIGVSFSSTRCVYSLNFL